MRVAIVGCGYVADYYLRMLPNHPELEVSGVSDRDTARASRLAAIHRTAVYQSLDELLADRRVDIILNLTNPGNHYAVSRACLEAGKHVYSEKPLALDFREAQELVRLAEARGLYLTAAPCSVLGETAQTAWKALRDNAVGRVRLVYAELDEGPVHRMGCEAWRNNVGMAWPYRDEFQVGCTLEHAGYYLTWLVAFFGPAKVIRSYAACLVPDKREDVPPEEVAPDFAVACIEFKAGVVARLTCSIVAPPDHGLRIAGDDGVLSVAQGWHYGSPVQVQKGHRYGRRSGLLRQLAARLGRGPKHGPETYPLVRPFRPRHRYISSSHQMDFARGVAELAAAVVENRSCRLSAQYALHVNELALAMQYPQRMGSPYTLTSSCEPMEPMPWAKG